MGHCVELKNYGQALSAAFENPSNHTNDDLGKVEELMQVFKEYCNRFYWSGRDDIPQNIQFV